ncbi:MAG: hypothetical protein Q9220_001876 [cf. Caloplaca sp. 1 TL-2023]
MGSTQRSYLVIGAGVFGTSTALHLIEDDPSASITLLDRTPFPCPHAASHDINKIVRADYGDIFYSNLALEAQNHWRNGSYYKPYYHETGLVNVEDTGLGRKIIQNYKDLGVDYSAEMITPKDAMAKWNGIYADGDWENVKEVFWNPQSGWVEAAAAVRRTTEAAVDKGVQYVEATVSELAFDGAGNCTGVRTANGDSYWADNVILCTGAQTAKLLADSAPQRKDLQVNGRMVAAAVVTAAVRLTPGQKEKFDKVPVFVEGMDHTLGETMPPTPDGLLKFCRDVSFTHNIYHTASGQTISVPPSPPSQSTWSQDVPPGLKEEAFNVMTQTYGKEVEGLEFESYRMCWDAVTPNQDWVITPHPHCGSLYIATAGSFHGWKFLPTVGAYVVKMLQNKLTGEQARRWAWDRDNAGAAHGALLPSRDLSDIEGYTSPNKRTSE